MYSVIKETLEGSLVEDFGEMTIEQVRQFAIDHYLGAGKMFKTKAAIDNELKVLKVEGCVEWLIEPGFKLHIFIK